MARVRFCSHTNSTLFTTCCDVAICEDQDHCPKCGEDVPYTARERWDMAMKSLYGAERVKKMRAEWRKKDQIKKPKPQPNKNRFEALEF